MAKKQRATLKSPTEIIMDLEETSSKYNTKNLTLEEEETEEKEIGDEVYEEVYSDG